MRNLLQLEWIIVRKYRAFWVFLGLFLLVLVGVNYVIYNIQVNIRTQGQLPIHLFDFPEIWSTTAWCSSFSILILGLLLIVMISNDFTFRTHRQHVIDGLSREQFIMGKWLMTGILLLFAWLVYVVVTLIVGGNSHPGAFSILSGFRHAMYFLLKIGVSLALAFIFTIWFKRAGLTITLFLVYALLLEGILKFILNRTVAGLGDFLPLSAAGRLVENPFIQFVPGLNQQTIPEYWLALTCVGYIFLFGGLSLRYIRRADL